MLFTKQQLEYLGALPSAVAGALPKSPNPDVPFFIDDVVIRNYELLRAVWHDRQSIRSACESAGCSRTDYYRLEAAFVAHGMAALYPQIGLDQQQPRLEQLSLLIKTNRPHATNTAILRLAEALRLEPLPSLRMIGQILHCHGMGNTRDDSDREYWQGIQQSVRAIESLRSCAGPPRSATDRRNNFYRPEESLQTRFELFRELALNPKANIGQVVRRYGVSRATFYKYLHRFRQQGPWGLVDWLQPGRGRGKLSEALVLRIIEEKLRHPRLSLDQLISTMKLRCSRTALHDVLRYWDLCGKDRPPVRLHGLWTDEDAKQRPPPLLTTAKDAAQAGQFQLRQRVSSHFSRLLEQLKSRPIAICDPGPIILAQFIDDLGICEALQVYGPKRDERCEMTNLLLVNICRILAGYETVGHLSANNDRSVAIAAGVGIYPGKTMLYDALTDLKFEHLQLLRNDVAARARDLGLIRGERIAQDFHFKEFYGQDANEEQIGKGPNSAKEICPGFRPHVAWDLDTDVLLNIAFCNGATRATKIVRQFCEKDIYPVIGRETIREIYMDSEYTSFPVIDYFVVDEFSSTDVLMCLKRNRRVDKLAQQIIAEATWEPFGKNYEIAGKRLELDSLGKALHFVVKRHKTTGELRCFGTTLEGLSNQEVLQRYRFRWPIENGLKDLIRSYFIDQILGKDPERIETNFYCVLVARLAYENFLRSLDARYVKNSAGHKRTLASFRYLLFGKQNCQIRLRGDQFELTFLDTGTGGLQSALDRLLKTRLDQGTNRVAWWGGIGLSVRFEDQHTDSYPQKCTKIVSTELS